MAGDRLRADELERRFGAAALRAGDLRAADLRVVDFELVFFAEGALRVAPDLRGAARVATGLDEAVVVPPSSSDQLPESTR